VIGCTSYSNIVGFFLAVYLKSHELKFIKTATYVCLSMSMQVSVGIKALPQLQHGEDYLCLFGSDSSTVVGHVSPNEVRCQTPVIPTLPFGEGELSLPAIII